MSIHSRCSKPTFVTLCLSLAACSGPPHAPDLSEMNQALEGKPQANHPAPKAPKTTPKAPKTEPKAQKPDPKSKADPKPAPNADPKSKKDDKHAKGKPHDGHEHHHGHKHHDHKPGKHKGHQHHHRHCDGHQQPNVPADPLTFTPASAAKKAGLLAGTAVAYGPLVTEEVYRNTIASEFNYITPENEMKWGSLQNTSDQRVWNFEQADAIVDFAKQHDLKVKGHALVWHSQAPSFVTSSLKKHELDKLVKAHVAKTMSHFSGDIFAWDVVNEAVADDGSGLRDSVFSQLLGSDFISKAFRQAHSADKKPRLIYNDYGTENLGAKSDALLALMQDLVKRQVPVDEVGFQAHFDARFAPSKEELIANFDRFGALGLDVNISELDVRVAQIAGNIAHKLAVQKEIYQRVAAACAEAANCTAITTWGFTDKHSWVDSFFGADDPLLFDENYQKKPAYFGFVDGLLGLPLEPVGTAPNLVGNSSFETGVTTWSMMGNGTLEVSRDHAHTGHRSAIARGRTATWNGPSYDLGAIVAGGRNYDVEVFARLGSGNANVNLTAAITCQGQSASYVQLDSAGADDTTWTHLSGSLALPDCNLENIVVYIEGPDASIDILVDDFSVREQPQPNLLDNGDFEAGAVGWFGMGATFTTTTDARSGNLAGIATGRTDSWNGVGANITSLVHPGSAYQLTGFLKVAGAASSPANFTAKLRCVGGSDQYMGIGYVTATDSSWVAVSGDLNVPDCALEEVLIYAEGPAAGIDLLVDDVSLMAKAAGLGPNVINNPGFESGTDYWYGFGDVSVSADAMAYSGSASGLVSGRTDSWQGLAQTITASVEQGKTYQVRGFARIAGAATSDVRLSVKTNCGGTDSFGAAASATATDTDWVTLDGAFTVPTCDLNELTVYIEGAPAGVAIYLDDVSVRQML
jgi:endo-1,4-beta-xylanase